MSAPLTACATHQVCTPAWAKVPLLGGGPFLF
jgi:hypothetical protein